MEPREILNHRHLQLTVERLCYQLIENHGNFDHSVLIGLQPRGVVFSKIIYEKLKELEIDFSGEYGVLDASMYRDDFRRRSKPIEIQNTDLDFSIEGKKVVLIDDVLYTGRSIRAALDALMDFGRPSMVEFLVLIDRRFSRQIPIKADYVGRIVDVVASERVRVVWEKSQGSVILDKAADS
ncbi:MAG TPA: bifunctional pyr operon transcriptional regulator/uracil phosphoribosyltransferase PyrR [Flavobacteriales bacterium]|jgi:pyrimidine operon attenuation protein/uracil phosphoribosyltransferase|nr:bifunctional pyr operon transcriptional regulator/uracil phosphoribosyltransferase PyrR [Flavobacteriales bacterium]